MTGWQILETSSAIIVKSPTSDLGVGLLLATEQVPPIRYGYLDSEI